MLTSFLDQKGPEGKDERRARGAENKNRTELFAKTQMLKFCFSFEVKYQHLSLLLRSHDENEESEEKDNFLPNHKSEMLIREIEGGRSPMILNRSIGGIKKIDAQLQMELKKRATIDRKCKRLMKKSESDIFC